MTDPTGKRLPAKQEKPAVQPSLAQYFAVSGPGLERLTAHELHKLGSLPEPPAVADTTQSTGNDLEGGVSFSGDLHELYRANLHLRTASRVLVRLGEFRAVAFYELRKKAARLPWESYLTPGQPVSLRVTCRKSRLYHSDAVAERVVGAIGDRLNRPSRALAYAEDSMSDEVQLVIVRFVHDICTISIDSSGAGLHRRGYRLAVAKAPLRETLAAGIILAARWHSEQPLVDPFCGSGTIAIEAALLASARPPGLDRKFAFMNWPGYDPAAWQKLGRETMFAGPPPQPVILASDRDAGAINMAQENADRAGVAEWIDFKQQAFSAIAPAGRGWVITNPPYGVRVSTTQDLRNLFAHLGDVLRQHCPGWNYAILSNEDKLIAQLHLPEAGRLWLENGGLPVKLVMGMVPEINSMSKIHAD
ncbi:MAG TPA: class I SAM-dependent RNA methyltransferase [Anaerolineales bacterium]|nr:class I SAM-dependent RNA methyltransferase [Anaerolineales bacterium]